MGIQERKDRDKAEMRELILNASKAVFMREGFEGFSIRKIAEVVEYSPATIYLYFKDKDEILYHLQVRAFDGMYAAFVELPTQLTASERLMAMGHFYLRFGFENPLLYRLMFHAMEPMRSECYDTECPHDYGAFRYLEQVVDDAIASGEMKGDTKVIATGMWLMLHGMITAHNDNRLTMLEKLGTENLDAFLQQVMHFHFDRLKAV